MSWCDPCADNPLSFIEFRQLGVDWVRRADASAPLVFVTRLHIRYSADSFFEGLKFAITEDRENFQGRYIPNHPFEGEITCDAGDDITATRTRIREEGRRLRRLTGWRNDIIQGNIAKSVDARYR
jgi:hypothetical protein